MKVGHVWMVHLTPTSTWWLYNVHGNTPQLLKVSPRTFFKFDRSFQVGIRPGESFFSWPPDGIGKMCSIQGDGWLRGLAPTNLFLFFVFYDVALCLPGAILRGLVASILRHSSISIIVSMLYVFIYRYTFIYIWYIRLSQMTCRGILGFWCLWLMICRDTFCNVLVVFILLGSCQPKIWPVLRKVLVPDEYCPIFFPRMVCGRAAVIVLTKPR